MMSSVAHILTSAMMVSCALGQTATVPLNHFDIDDEMTDGIWVKLQLGTPAQDVAVLFDTGSSTLAVPPAKVSSCDTCAAFNSPCQFPQCNPSDDDTSSTSCVVGAYNPNSSSSVSFVSSTSSACGTGSSSANGRCPVAVAYGLGSSGPNCHQGFIGDVAHDKLSLGGYSGTVPLVAITTLQSGFQEAPCAGIMGVAFSELNVLPGSMDMDQSSGETSEPDAFGSFLVSAGLSNEFSLCMGSASQQGTLVLGGTESQYYTGAWQTTNIQSGGYYNINVESINLAGNSIGISTSSQSSSFSASQPIVDSGTPELYLPSSVYTALSSTASSTSCSSNADCSINVLLSGGVTLEAPDLLTCSSTCQMSSWVLNGGSTSIVGYAVIRNYYTHFNREAMTVSFADAADGCGPDTLPSLSSEKRVSKMERKNIVHESVNVDIDGDHVHATDLTLIGLGAGVIVLVGLIIALFIVFGKRSKKGRAPPFGEIENQVEEDPFLSNEDYAQ